MLEVICTLLIFVALWTSSGYHPLFALLIWRIMSLTDSQWGALVGAYSDGVLVVVGTILVSLVTYVTHGSLYLILDITKKPQWLYRYKLQPAKSFSVSLLKRIGSKLLLGYVIFIPYVWALYRCEVIRVDMISLPSSQEMGLELLVIILSTEVCFYTSHWILHWPSLYPHIHKIHHEFTSPVALVAGYAHPVEFFVSNIFSTTAGAWVYSPHLFTWYVWMLFGVIGTQVHHSGYRFPWHWKVDHEPDFHDFHHEAFTSNFGLLGVMDYIFGTDRKYREHLNKRKAIR